MNRLILGCNALSTLPTRRTAFALLDTALACGFTHFDTARSYGRGFSERILGEFLGGFGDAVRVTTKLGPARDRLAFLPTRLALPLNYLHTHRRGGRGTGPAPTASGGKPTRIIGRDEVEQSIARSLRCLRRSRLDIFLLHECLPSQLDPGARQFLSDLRKDGTIGLFGIGTTRSIIDDCYTDDPLVDVLQYGYSTTTPDPLVARFPNVMHIHHSIFRPPVRTAHHQVIRDALAANPAGRVIFGTRNPAHLKSNVSFLA